MKHKEYQTQEKENTIMKRHQSLTNRGRYAGICRQIVLKAAWKRRSKVLSESRQADPAEGATTLSRSPSPLGREIPPPYPQPPSPQRFRRLDVRSGFLNMITWQSYFRPVLKYSEIIQRQSRLFGGWQQRCVLSLSVLQQLVCSIYTPCVKSCAANIHTYYYQYSITPHSFIPGLKPSFSANPSHHSILFLLQD